MLQFIKKKCLKHIVAKWESKIMVINAKKALKAVPRENNTLKGYICQEF